MNLSGGQIAKLREALLSAFPREAQLERMLREQLNKNLKEIAGGSNLQEIVFEVIQRACSEGWIDKLIRAAYMSNSGNPALKALAQELLNPNPLDNDHYSACNVDYIKLQDLLMATKWNWGFGEEFKVVTLVMFVVLFGGWLGGFGGSLTFWSFRVGVVSFSFCRFGFGFKYR